MLAGMKNILLSLFLLSAAPLAAQHTTPQKGDARILIQLPDSGRVAWQRTAAILTQAGYGIAAASPELLTFTTTERSISTRNSVQIFVSGAVQRNTVTLTGRWNLTGGDGNTIVYRGMQGSPFMLAWAELERLAKSMNGQISYAP